MKLLRKLYSDKNKKSSNYYLDDGEKKMYHNHLLSIPTMSYVSSPMGARFGIRAVKKTADRYGQDIPDKEIIREAKKAGGIAGGISGVVTAAPIGAIIGGPNMGAGAAIGAGIGGSGGYFIGRNAARLNAQRAIDLRDKNNRKNIIPESKYERRALYLQ